jgi:hypothetical protein
MDERVRQIIAAVTGEPHDEWCPTCKAWTLVCTPLYLLTPAGVTLHQHIALCEICDLDDEEPRRV